MTTNDSQDLNLYYLHDIQLIHYHHHLGLLDSKNGSLRMWTFEIDQWLNRRTFTETKNLNCYSN